MNADEILAEMSRLSRLHLPQREMSAKHLRPHTARQYYKGKKPKTIGEY